MLYDMLYYRILNIIKMTTLGDKLTIQLYYTLSAIRELTLFAL